MKFVWGIALSFWGVQALALPDWQPQILADAGRLYAPVATAEHLTMNFNALTDLTHLAASAENDGVHARVTIDGGMLASPRLTADSLRITVCHELGHIFGGAPRRNVPLDWDGAMAQDGRSLMSAEGEADYYATLVCFRKMVEGQNHQAELAGKIIPAATKSKCEAAWGANSNEALVCQRAALASLDFLNFIRDFDIGLDRHSDETPATPILDQYPSRQCRLDTFVAGALCRTNFPMQLDRRNASVSECPQSEARRPACWFPRLGPMAAM